MSTTPIFASSFFLTGSILAASTRVQFALALTLPTGCRASRFVARPAASATRRRIRAAQ
jgi:hypothetical protein